MESILGAIIMYFVISWGVGQVHETNQALEAERVAEEQQADQ